MLMRVKRLGRRFREIRRQSGTRAAISYAARYAVAKAPVLLREARGAARRNSVARQIASVREDLDGVPLLAIRVTGGIGDRLVVARFMRDLAAYASDLRFDVYALGPDVTRWAFGGVPGFREAYDEAIFDFVIGEYDLALRVSQFVIMHEQTANWRRVRESPQLARVAANLIRFRPKIEAFVQHHPYLDGFLARVAVYANRTRADFLHHMAGIPYGGDRLGIGVADDEPGRRGLAPGYITVHNGFDPEFVISGSRATKCYPHFGAVIDRLKSRYPQLRFVQVGTSATSEPIAEADLNLIGLTSLPQVGALIAGALLHIDNEGGLAHLAACLGTTSCVVFGPTPADFFGYSGNINVSPSYCGGCWWINETWMSRCPRGFAEPRCLTEQDPESVAAAIMPHLSRSLATKVALLPAAE